MQKELLDPAIKGTMNVLTAAKEAGVRRVVLTSSISAVTPSPNWPGDVAKTEECWTDVEYSKQKGVREGFQFFIFILFVFFFFSGCVLSVCVFVCVEQLWYPLSKTLAEKAAWDFAKENDLDVVVVNPGTVMGPVIPPRLNASMVMLVRLLQGNDRWLINCFFFFFCKHYCRSVFDVNGNF